MNQMTEREMTTSVSQVAQNLGYKVEMEPSTRHWRNLRRSYLSPINFGRVLRPDLLVSYGDQSVVVEIKNTGVLFGGVEQVLLYAKVFNAAGVLCMPDDAYSDVPASVSGYADGENVLICPISKIGNVLTNLLGPPDNRNQEATMPDSLDQIVESYEAERLATGFEFTEGPLWHPDGYLLFVNNRINVIYRLTPGGEPEVIRENSGGANGLTFDLQGRIIMCDGDDRQMTRWEPDGSITVIADRWEGKRLHRPNDVVCRSDGSIYFTNPGLRLPPEEREIDFHGIHRIAPDGTVTAVITDLESPNGLVFSPDESILYADNTRRGDECAAEKERGEVCTHQYIRAYDVAADGSVSNSRLFANMHSAEDGVPDGMKVDTDGRVYCTGAGGVWVFEADGALVGVIELPEIPANCAWGDADYRTMYFTARSSVYRMRMKTTGINPWRGG